MLEQDNLFAVGKHQLKNGWVLTVSEYEGSYAIDKSGVYGIWAKRVTGGGFGDGIWSIKYSLGGPAHYQYQDVHGGFTLEVCNSIIDTMEAMMVTHNIEDFNTPPKKVKKSKAAWIKDALKRMLNG